MKIKILFVFLCAQMISYGQQTWRAMGVDDFDRASTGLSAPAGKNPIWVKNDQVFVFNLEQADYFGSMTYYQRLSIAKYSGQWEHIETPFYFGQSASVDCIVDMNGVPHVFLNDPITNKATVKKYVGNEWVDVGGGPVSETSSSYHNLLLDPNGVIYIAYNGAVKKFNGNNWITLTAIPDIDSKSIFAFDHNYVLYAMYSYQQNANYFCFVKKLNGANWEEVGITDFAGEGRAMAIDQNNVPYAYIGDSLRKFNGNSWEIVSTAYQIGIANTWSEHYAVYNLKFDDANTLYLQYAGNGPLFGGLKKWVNGVWQNLSGGGGSYKPCGLAFENSNTYKLTFDFAGGGSNTVSKVAKITPGGWEFLAGSASPFYFANDLEVCNGTPMVSYVDDIYGYKTTVRKFANGWEFFGSPAISESTTNNSRIKASGDGKIYLAYNNRISDTERKVTVKQATSSGWQAVGDINFSVLAGDVLDLAVSHAYEPSVLYRSGRVQKYDGTNWVFVGGNAFNGDIDGKLVFDNNDVPYIVTTASASIRKFNGSAWEVVTPPTLGIGSIDAMATIAFDSSNNLYLAYINFSYEVRVIKFDGTTWEWLGSSGIVTTEQTTSIAFALDHYEVPYVLVNEAIDNFRKEASLKKFNGTDWEFVGTPLFSGGTISNAKLAFANNNTPIVGYRTVYGDFFKYFGEVDAWLGVDESVLKNNQSIAIVPNPVNDYLTVNGNNISHVTIYDLTGKKVIEQKSTTVDASRLQSGMYLLKAVTPEGIVNSKFIKQ